MSLAAFTSLKSATMIISIYTWCEVGATEVSNIAEGKGNAIVNFSST